MMSFWCTSIAGACSMCSSEVIEKVFNFLECPPLTFRIPHLVDTFEDGAEEIVLVVVEGSDFTDN